MKLLAAARGLLSARPLLSAAVAAAPPHGRTSAVTVRVSLAVPTSAPGARPARPPPPQRQTTGDARWLLLVADDQGRLQHVRRFSAAQLAQSGQLAFAMPMSAGHAFAHLLHPEHRATLITTNPNPSPSPSPSPSPHSHSHPHPSPQGVAQATFAPAALRAGEGYV